MPRLARIVVAGESHHIIQRGNNRQDVFFVEDDRVIYGSSGLSVHFILAHHSKGFAEENAIVHISVGYELFIRFNVICICCFTGPKVRVHTSLGQRPRFLDAVIPQG